MTTTASRLSHAEFALRAIARLRKPPYKGIHSVYSGFNKAFAEYFGEDPIKAVQKLEQGRVILMRPAKGGATIYKFDEAPAELVAAKDRVSNKVAPARRLTALQRIVQD